MITKEQAVNSGYGTTFRYLGAEYKSRDRKGEPVQVRVSGKCQVWKSRPDEFRLPVKYGMYDSFAITHENAALFVTEEQYENLREQTNAVVSVLKKNPRKRKVRKLSGAALAQRQARKARSSDHFRRWFTDSGKKRLHTMFKNPSLKPFASNMNEMVLEDGTTILFSYQTPVAAQMPGVGFFKTNKKWSIATSRHIAKWLLHHGANKVTAVDQEAIDIMATGVKKNPGKRIKEQPYIASAQGNFVPKKHVCVLVETAANVWQTIAQVKDKPELRLLAKRFAKTYKRKHPGATVKVVV